MLDFDEEGLVYFEDHEGNYLCLRKATWEKVLSHREREHLKYNIDKMRESILQPLEVRRSTQDPDVKIIYGEFGTYAILPNIMVTREGWVLTIVVKRDLILTTYPAPRIKEGERLWPLNKK